MLKFNSGPGEFPGGPMVKNSSCNVGDVGSTPGQGTKNPMCRGAAEPAHHNFWARELWSPESATREARLP